MSELQTLFQLQELDLRSEERNAELQEIESGLGETDELIQARGRVETLRGLLHDQEQRLRELEWDAAEQNRHVAQDEQKLYSGRVRNPKELEDIQRDVQQYRARLSQIEDRELQLMTDVEATQADLQRAQAELARVRADWEARQRELGSRQSAVGEALAALRHDRRRLTAEIGSANLSLYEKLRREKRGRAISRIERGTCLGCRIALPMGLAQKVRADRDMVFCPSCGRILYA
jgi:predicted  nucleic acid-binding Zn-ribbon protein